MLWQVIVFEDWDSKPKKHLIDVPSAHTKNDEHLVYTFAAKKFGVDKEMLLCKPAPPEMVRN